MRKTLDELGQFHNTDKASFHAHPHDYLRHYEKFLSPLRDTKIKLLEIGVGGGESIRMWLDYFPKAKIYGVDIVPGMAVERGRYIQVHGDQSDAGFWAKFIQEHGSDWNVVIDDGGHFSNQIITSFVALWPHVVPGGFYAVEDLYCAYNSIFQSDGFQNHMDFIKDMLDSINRRERDIEQLHFSRELAIIQKRP